MGHAAKNQAKGDRERSKALHPELHVGEAGAGQFLVQQTRQHEIDAACEGHAGKTDEKKIARTTIELAELHDLLHVAQGPENDQQRGHEEGDDRVKSVAHRDGVPNLREAGKEARKKLHRKDGYRQEEAKAGDNTDRGDPSGKRTIDQRGQTAAAAEGEPGPEREARLAVADDVLAEGLGDEIVKSGKGQRSDDETEDVPKIPSGDNALKYSLGWYAKKHDLSDGVYPDEREDGCQSVPLGCEGGAVNTGLKCQQYPNPNGAKRGKKKGGGGYGKLEQTVGILEADEDAEDADDDRDIPSDKGDGEQSGIADRTTGKTNHDPSHASETSVAKPAIDEHVPKSWIHLAVSQEG